jgi:hypothetical protein
MNTFSYICLFAAIQLVSLVLTVIGIPIIALLAIAAVETTQERLIKNPSLPTVVWGWPRPFWIWSNSEDGVWGPYPHSRWYAFYWTALRNPVNNLRFVPGISMVGRPLWYRTWTMFGKEFYAKAGWLTDGYPALSAGAGKGF